MSKIVRTAANLLLPFILMFGFYIVVHGHLTPERGCSSVLSFGQK